MIMDQFWYTSMVLWPTLVFLKKSGLHSSKSGFNAVKEQYPVILSLKWESEPDYKESIKAAADKSRLLFETLFYWKGTVKNEYINILVLAVS